MVSSPWEYAIKRVPVCVYTRNDGARHKQRLATWLRFSQTDRRVELGRQSVSVSGWLALFAVVWVRFYPTPSRSSASTAPPLLPVYVDRRSTQKHENGMKYNQKKIMMDTRTTGQSRDPKRRMFMLANLIEIIFMECTLPESINEACVYVAVYAAECRTGRPQETSKL